jgi:hypothetical protein
LFDQESVNVAEVFERFSFVPDIETVAQVLREDERFGELEGSYLAVLMQEEWDEGLQMASQYETSAAPEWVTFISGDGYRGVSMPEDASPVPRISLFRETRGSVGRMSITWFRNSPLWTSVEHAMSSHCSFPDRGQCASGRCGQCTLQTREAEPRGLVCTCSHTF